jgi:hypothetical protein
MSSKEVLFIYTCVLGASCTAKKKEQVLLGGEYQFQGSMDAQSGVSIPKDTKALKGYLIGEDGQREPIPRFHYQPTDHSISFALKKSDLTKHPGLSLLEAMASFGKAEFFLKNTVKPFGDTALGYARVELFPDGALEGTGSLFPYFQGLVAVTQAAALSPNPVIQWVSNQTGTLDYYPVERLKVKVINSSGEPLNQASVSIVNLTGDVSNLGFNLPLVDPIRSKFGPVWSKTNAKGEAIAFPLPFGTPASFQILAQADGYCPYLSSQKLFSPTETSTEVVLETCDSAEIRIKELSWKAKFGKSLFTEEETGHTNKGFVSLNLKTFSKQIRGLKVKVFEGIGIGGTLFRETIYPTFSSEMTTLIPTSFGQSDGSKSPDGNFTISIESILNPEDIPLISAPPPQILKGVRYTQKPKVQATQALLKSSLGVDGIVSGLPGNEMKLQYEKCSKGMQIGLKMGNFSGLGAALQFVPCPDDGSKSVTLKTDALFALSCYLSSDTEAQIFVKDKYGNESEDDIEKKSNHLSVFIDCEKPEWTADSLPLGGRFGFAPKNAAIPADGVYDFYANQQRISATQLSNLRLRFDSLGSCKLPGVLDERSLGIETFGFKQENTIKPDTNCGNDREILPNDIKFPTQPTEPATFQLWLQDKAGHLSNPVTYSIPSCAIISTNASEGVCWEP